MYILLYNLKYVNSGVILKIKKKGAYKLLDLTANQV